MSLPGPQRILSEDDITSAMAGINAHVDEQLKNLDDIPPELLAAYHEFDLAGSEVRAIPDLVARAAAFAEWTKKVAAFMSENEAHIKVIYLCGRMMERVITGLFDENADVEI